MTHALAIELKDVSKKYITKTGINYAVDNVNLTVEAGAFISLVGPSGCGKTTLLSLIAGLFPPSGGEIRIFGQKVEGPTSQVGYMLQQDYLLPWRNIYQNILLGLEITHTLNRETEEHALYLLEEMGLIDYRLHYPHQLSGGMRQRVALVRTLATEPDILLLDEPFSALDYQTKLRLEDLVSSTLKKHAKTAVLVTHDLSEAVAMSDRVYVFSRNPGRINTVIEIPPVISEKTPLASRNIPEFQTYFQRLWEELDVYEDR
ncbi:MAG: ABC transporter ATP-binding protein [Clostridia bacterium]|nr:ABC transporter ATP-binding protein [Clostridia bacterium]